MNNKWFNSVAIEGSGFEHLADKVVVLDQLTNEKISQIDLLFTDKPSQFFSKFKGFHFTVVCDKEILPENQEMYLLENPGNSFISRVGHDITNLFFPLEHFEYIEDELIRQRTLQGIRFGRQINIIGHLLQNTKEFKGETADFNEVIQTVTTICRKNKIILDIINPDDSVIENLPPANLFNHAIDEILLNWIAHGTDDFKLTIGQKIIIFSNSFKGNIDPVRAKAKLRCPFRKKNTGTGAGLGLYIVSLASVRGGFDWDISIHENSFSLSLLF